MTQDVTIPDRKPVRTMADIARLAGVSAGTVSRALTGSPLVNADTRRQIEAIATAHAFRPNQLARHLRTRRSNVIGVVVPLGHERRQHLSDPFFMTILAELADALTENGYDIMLSRIIPNERDWLDRIVASGMLDGLLLIGQSDQHAAIDRLAESYLPLIAWGSILPGQVHCSIGTDNLAGGRLAGLHLAARGARRIAFLGDIRTPEIRLRYQGVTDALSASAMAAPLQLDVHLASDIMEREIAAHVDRIVAAGIDGIAAASDILAITAIRVLADRGIDVPGRIRIVGYDDLPIAGQSVPRLTTVRQDIAGGAKEMVAALFARIGGRATPSIEMRPILVERNSS